MSLTTSPEPLATRPVHLADRTSLGVGGWAETLTQPADDDAVREVLRAAREAERPVAVLGGGTNLLVADAGWPGVILQPADRTLVAEPSTDGRWLHLRAGAGVAWERVVDAAVRADAGGLECLTGIPGSVGASPIQNIGAYGQELAASVERVRAVDRSSGESVAIDAADCGFGYRSSHFKGRWRDRFVITAVEFRLPIGVPAAVRYPQLRDRLDAMAQGTHTLAAVRRAVRALRREKAMLLDPDDATTRADQRSAGSFFTNPVVSATEADAVAARAVERGTRRPMPRYPTDDDAPNGDCTKLSAAWLIEEAGFSRGWGEDVRGGRARLSTRHTLAITNRGDATADDIVALAARLRRGVHDAFGVLLDPEPVFLGFDRPAAALLDAVASLDRTSP